MSTSKEVIATSSATKDLDSAAVRELTVAEYRGLSKQSPWRLLAIGARLISGDVLDELSRLGTNNLHDWVRLQSIITDPHIESFPDDWDVNYLVVATFLACTLNTSDENIQMSATAMRKSLKRLNFNSAYANIAIRLAIQVSVLSRSTDLFEWCRKWAARRPESIWAGEVDFVLELANASLMDGAGGDADVSFSVGLLEEWWSAFNKPMVDVGLEPFELVTPGVGEPVSFEHIHAPTINAEAIPGLAQPLVSIIVPSFNPGPGLVQAIESLTRQTWKNIEVIIVDDCSSEGSEYFDQVASMDSRVRVERLPVNGGAYRARNVGLRLAGGKFVTIQDDDDISHPRRIERHAEPLIADPRIVASISRGQRVGSDATLTNFGALPHSRNMSSNFVRLEPLRTVLGRFDDVRKGSDAELIERMTSAFGIEAVVELDDTLALLHQTTGSLSRSDFRLGWMSGDRVGYTHQYRGMHRQISREQSPNWKLTQDRPRCAWAAPRMLGTQLPASVDFALLGDWSIHIERPTNGAGLVDRLHERGGAPVGLLNGISPRFSLTHRDPISEELWEKVESGRATWMSWADRTYVDTLIITDPEYLNFLPIDQEIGFTVGKVWILLDQSLRGIHGEIALPPLAWLQDRVRRVFGVEAIWRVASQSIEVFMIEQGFKVLPPLIPSGRISNAQLEEQRARTLGIPLPATRDRKAWNLESLFKMIMPRASDRIYLYGLLSEEQQEWCEARDLVVLNPDEISRATFLDQIDIVLVDPWDEGLIGAASWIFSAASVGALCVAPYRYEQEFSDLVTSFRAGGLSDVLLLLEVDQEFFLSQIEKSGSRIEQSFREEASAAEGRFSQPTVPSLTFVVHSSADAGDINLTRTSIEAAVTAAGQDRLLADIIELVPMEETSLARQLRTSLAMVSHDTLICLIPAGTTLAYDALYRLNHPGQIPSLSVFLEGNYDYPLNKDLDVDATINIAGDSPIWVGSTPVIYKRRVLDSALELFPETDDLQALFSLALLTTRQFQVIGMSFSDDGHEDKLDSQAELYSENWYLDFIKFWERLLAEVALIGDSELARYFSASFLYLLQFRLKCNMGVRNKGALSGAVLDEFMERLHHALQNVAIDEIVNPPHHLAFVGRPVRHWLLEHKGLNSVATTLTFAADEAKVQAGVIVLDRSNWSNVGIDVMDVRDDHLKILGRWHTSLLNAHGKLRLRGHGIDVELSDTGRYADIRIFGKTVARQPTFTVSVPLETVKLAQEMQFVFVPSGSTKQIPLRLTFPKPMSKLSNTANSYWIAGRKVILRRTSLSIRVQPYSKAASLRAELGRQRALRKSADELSRNAARLRLSYFLDWRRTFKLNRSVWMYADRITNGGDNGEYAFEYAAKQRDGVVKHYVAKEGTELARSLRERGLKFLPFKSQAQRLAFLQSEVVFATRVSPTSTFGFLEDEQYFRDLFNYRVIYINHGLVVDQLDQVLNKASGNIDTICVVSEIERKNLLQPNYGYTSKEIEVTGFARYDGLVNKRRRQILLTPTWRAYLHQPQRGEARSASNTGFQTSHYFRVFNSLINNTRLLAALDEFDFDLVYLLHPNTSSQILDFQVTSDRVRLVSAEGERSYESLLTESMFMITDYSGVQFDFAYMRKPIIYYHRPEIPPHYEEASFNYQEQGFGPIASSEGQLVDDLIALMSTDGDIEPAYLGRIESFFAHTDRQNSERVYEVGHQVRRRLQTGG